MPTDVFVSKITELFEQACTPDTQGTGFTPLFSDAKFFRLYYRQHGTPYFFLFKKNLRITNIQFAELLALLRAHSKESGGANPRDLRFVSTNDFREWIKSVVFTFNKDLKPDRFAVIAKMYEHILRRTVVVDPFFTSCSVFYPPALSADLLSICAFSGYIHSCGKSVSIRKTDKTDKNHLFEAIDAFLASDRSAKRLFFEVYAHEDFTKQDRNLQADLSHGLDDVKIYVEKYHMGGNRLVSVIEDLRARYRDKLIIPDPGDYRRQVKEKFRHSDLDQSRTLWLIKDQSIHQGGDRRFFSGADSFYICYEQVLKNENPLHIFDENKPGWYSHTTIPHTLMGAMINITRPLWKADELTTIADPFAGTGTTYLESLKYEGVTVDCGDTSPLAEVVSQDNREFFSKTSQQLELIAATLTRLLSLAQDSPNQPLQPELFDSFVIPDETYEFCKMHIAQSKRKIDNLPGFVAKRIGEFNFDQRLVIYVCLRAKIRGGAALERQSMSWNSAVEKECRELLGQVNRLRQQRQDETQLVDWPGSSARDVIVYQGDYSYCCSLSRNAFLTQNASEKIVKQRDCLDLPSNSADVVVSDPPYGFNTDDEALELGELWAKAIRKMLQALRYGKGQIVLCLPDHTHIGRQLHFFTNKQFVTHQVLGLAGELGIMPTRCTDIVPRPLDVFRPPYYWESERALRRSILHFVLLPNDFVSAPER